MANVLSSYVSSFPLFPTANGKAPTKAGDWEVSSQGCRIEQGSSTVAQPIRCWCGTSVDGIVKRTLTEHLGGVDLLPRQHGFDFSAICQSCGSAADGHRAFRAFHRELNPWEQGGDERPDEKAGQCNEQLCSFVPPAPHSKWRGTYQNRHNCTNPAVAQEPHSKVAAQHRLEQFG